MVSGYPPGDMQDWETLTEAGRIRRLRALALDALDQFPIEPVRLRLVGGFTNVIFRVDTTEGPFALRVDLHQDHSDKDVDIELAWLAAIAGETDLDTCRFVSAHNGKRYVYGSAPGVPGERRCVLFQWVPGRPLADNPTEVGYERLGQLSAGLHKHGRDFRPPHPPMKWDRVFYWPEEVDPVVIYEPRLAHHFPEARKQTLDRAIDAIQTAFARLGPQSAQVIHGDLHPWNVHAYRSRLIAFDFEDVMWGHRVQDVAISLFYQRDHPGYADFRSAFEEGYRSMADWPVAYEGELEHFMAARTVMFINYVANIDDDPSRFYDKAFPRLQRFLDTWVD